MTAGSVGGTLLHALSNNESIFITHQCSLPEFTVRVALFRHKQGQRQVATALIGHDRLVTLPYADNFSPVKTLARGK